MPDDEKTRKRAERIAHARANLQAAYDADPEATQRFHARMAKLAAAKKREQERFDTLVLGNRPAPAPTGPRPKGIGRAAWVIEKKRRREASIAEQSLAAKWSHKQGTPETLEHVARRAHQGALDQLEANGTIDKEQREWAAQIANVHRSIEADVAVSVASLEARVDQSRSSAHLAVEGIHRVRMHHAYTIWRDRLPAPKQLVLDMIVGDAIGYTVAAARHRVHKRTAKRRLLHAIDIWPACVDEAFRAIDRDLLDRLNAA